MSAARSGSSSSLVGEGEVAGLCSGAAGLCSGAGGLCSGAGFDGGGRRLDRMAMVSVEVPAQTGLSLVLEMAGAGALGLPPSDRGK